MAAFNIIIKKSAAKELAGIPQPHVSRVIKRIRELADNPRPPGAQKLASFDLYRIRLGDYRIVYSIDDTNITIEIIKIGHRKDVYRL